MSDLSKKKAVIGLGNTLRGDDGIGLIILESLLNSYKRAGIDYLNFGSASFDLMHKLQDYDTVLLIDGISANLAAGELRIFELKDASFRKRDRAISSHELNLKDIIKLADKLKLNTKIYVAGIQVESVNFTETLSQKLKDKLQELTAKIDKFLAENLV
jgi:hydrogenase maturation protease